MRRKPKRFGCLWYTLTNEFLVRAALTVILKIADKSEADCDRVTGRVRLIEPLPRNAYELTAGRWALYPQPGPRDCPPDDDYWTWYGVGKIQVRERDDWEPWQALAVFAHEFGHVAARKADVEKRARVIDDEWANESVADYYAYKWGFGRQIRRLAKRRPLGHHGALPGETIIVGTGKEEREYRMSRDFVYHLIRIGSKTCEGQQ